MSVVDGPLGDIASVILFENEKVRIWNLIVEPGQTSAWHQHERDYVTLLVEGGGLTVEYEDGTSEVGHTVLGNWRYHDDHKIHRVHNHTDQQYKNLLIEFK